METVTITRTALTRRGRMALFCGEEFLFSVDGETYAAEGLHTGATLTAGELERLRLRSEERRACDKALDYLSLRDYAGGELYRKLLTKFDAPAAAAAVAKMEQLQLVDDEAFVRHRVQYLLRHNKSRREIVHSLTGKGVDRALTERVLDEACADADADGAGAEVAAVCRLIDKNYRRKLEEGRRDNVIAALCRRGFGLSTIRRALEMCQIEAGEEEFF